MRLLANETKEISTLFVKICIFFHNGVYYVGWYNYVTFIYSTSIVTIYHVFAILKLLYVFIDI